MLDQRRRRQFLTRHRTVGQRLRPRRHHRPPPDAPARRLLRQAASVPAGRLRHHRQRHRPRPHGARPWRGRFRAVQGERHRPGLRGRRATASTAPTGCGSAGRAASSTPSSTRRTGRSAPTCAKPARCSPRARTSSTAIRIRWRSKAKVIYRCTPQWFVPMDRPLPSYHCESFAEQRWDNEGGAVEQTPDASPAGDARHRRHPLRARKGPQPHRLDGRGAPRLGAQPPARLGRADRAVRRSQDRPTARRRRSERSASSPPSASRASMPGTPRTPQAFLGDDRNPDDYEMVTDILDVWFDSGSTHAFVLESGRWPEQRWPADLYLEGSDQHRGWFQSSLLESCGTRGRAPYQRGADPWLHDGRQGPEDVQEPRQHGRPARPDEGAWRRHLAAVGAVGRLHRGPPHRQGNPRRRRRPVSQAPQHLPLPARRARRLPRGGEGRHRGDAGAGALHAPPDRGAGQEASRRRSTISTSTPTRGCCRTSPTTICRPSTSISARTSSTAT